MLKSLLAATIFLHALVGFAAEEDLLKISPPKAWGSWMIQGSKRIGNILLTSRAPVTDNNGQWKETVVTFAFFPIAKGESTISSLIQVAKLENSVCEGMNIVPPKAKKENGFTVSYMQTFCPKHRGLGQGRVGFYKAISTPDRIFVVGTIKVVQTESFGPMPGMFVGDAVKPIRTWQAESSEYLASSVYACPEVSSKRETCSQ